MPVLYNWKTLLRKLWTQIFEQYLSYVKLSNNYLDMKYDMSRIFNLFKI